MRSADRCDFEALRSRQGQAEAILVAYDIMEADGQDVRPEALEERRNRLAKLLTPETKRCETASDSVRRSPETGPPSSGTRVKKVLRNSPVWVIQSREVHTSFCDVLGVEFMCIKLAAVDGRFERISGSDVVFPEVPSAVRN